MSKYNMVDLDGNNLGSLDSSSNTVKNSNGKTIYTIKGKYLISEKDDEVLTIENDGRVADESGKQVGYIYNYKDFKESRSTKTSTTKSTSSSSTNTKKSSTTTSKPKTSTTSNSNSTSTKKSSWTDWLWLGAIVFVLYLIFGHKSIEGTWVVSGIEYEGKTYSITESGLRKFADATGTEISTDRINSMSKYLNKMEINFKKGGTGTIRSDEYSQGYSRFTWDKDGNEITLETETTLEDYGAVTKLEMKNGKLRLEVGDSILIFKKK